MAADNEKRFKVVYSQGLVSKIQIIRDIDTGVEYLCISNGQGTGITPLLNREGRPIVGRD